MKERPILFSQPMIQAILSGRKTQTRRVLKECKTHPGKLCRTDYFNSSHTALAIPKSGNWVWHPTGNLTKEVTTDVIQQYCPYGKIGDYLWCRETFRFDDFDSNEVIYKADIPNDVLVETKGIAKWKPSIFMPRTASRITLEITDIRVERIQDITLGDIQAEGCELFPKQGEMLSSLETAMAHERCFIWFKDLWNKINAERGFSFESNPFVWCLGFKKL